MIVLCLGQILPNVRHRAPLELFLSPSKEVMQCGVELAATEFAPSYRRATVMQATCAAVGLLSSLAAWLAGASLLVNCGRPTRQRHSFHVDRDPSHQQAAAQSDTG